jgi:hypothetical protein
MEYTTCNPTSLTSLSNAASEQCGNEVLFASYTFATEVVLCDKLGKNEVFAASFFQLNFRKKNFAPFEHPTLQG